MSIRNWNIRARLVLALIGVLIPFLALAGVGVIGTRALWRDVLNVNDQAVRVVKETADLQLALSELSKPVKLYLITGDAAAGQQFEERLARVQEALARMDTPLFEEVDERQLLAAVRNQVPQIEALSREILVIPDPRRDRAAPAKMSALIKLGDRATAALSEFYEIGLRKMEADFAHVLDVIWRALAYGLGILVLSILGGVALALVFSSWLSRPILAIAQGSRRMAAGDLSHRVSVRAGGELGKTAQAFNEMAERLEASYVAMTRRNEELAALGEISRAVSSSLDLREVLDAVMGHAVNLSSSDGCAVFEFNPSRHAFVGVWSRHVSKAFLDEIQAMQVDPRKSATSRAAASGQPVQIPDLSLAIDYPFREVTLKEGFRAVLAIPMSGEDVTRALVLFRRAPGVFEDRVVNLLTALANQSKVALDNARLFQELRASTRDLEQLYQLSTSIQEAMSLQDRLNLILHATHEVIGLDRAIIWLPTPDDAFFQPAAHIGWDPQEVDETIRIAIDGPVPALTKPYREGTEVVVDGVATVPEEFRLREPYVRSAFLRSRNFVALPLVSRGRSVGVFVADNWGSRRPLAPSLEILRTFAASAAISIETARLFQEVEEKNRQLEIANRHKSEFLANMSHELRTPLNAILGYSEMLQEEAGELGQERFVGDLRKINSAGKHLLELINAVLDLSKIEAGKMELYLETFSVAAMVRDIGAVIQPLAEKNGNRLEVHCDEQVGTMRADLTKVRQALFNLLSNACKFTRDGTVSLTVVREKPPAADWLTFRARDTGIGMTPEQMEKLFQEFSQADPTTAGKYGGTGLGLALSRRLCRMMGGDIDAVSEAGRGSTFTIRLPATVVDIGVEREAAVGLAPAPAGVTSVLVIDDESAVRDLMQRFLTREGFRVTTAAGGEEGLRLARELLPDAITLDVIMPGMDGWAVLSALKADPELAAIPVIMLTIVDDRNMGYTLGAADYLTKPVDRDRLMAVLHKYRQEPFTILVVDDDAAFRELLRRMLEKEGCLVAEAENGRVALERVREAPPALILLDLMMPELDGFEFVAEFRKHEGWRAIPIVVVTAKDLSGEERLQLNGHVERILQKGAYSRDTLLREVREMVAACVRRRAA